jgi:CDGSH-type Zn-finger protein/uncharacterized Fe-S cluster protein YjdI
MEVSEDLPSSVSSLPHTTPIRNPIRLRPKPMESEINTYTNDDIEVTYDVKRCIHAAACVSALPDVFDPEKNPWIDPEQGSADAVANAVHQCPTGALHYQRRDDGPSETPPTENTVTLFPNGPLLLRGTLELVDTDGDVLLTDTRMALCRCGQSDNMPLCNGSHASSDFEDAGAIPDAMTRTDELPTEAKKLRIIFEKGSPATLQGPFRLEGATGTESTHTKKAYVCRCGQSGTKPFCDGSHTAAGFST